MSTESAIRVSDNWFVGEDKVFRFKVKDAAGAAINMTAGGYSLEWVLRTAPNGTVLLTKTLGSGITIVNGDATNDAADVTVTDDDTLNAPINAEPGVYYHTLRKTNPGDEQVLAFGDAFLRLSAGR